ncbi:DUF6416 domain-containing protein [Serinicoccus marinus]|nr:DUF6416 domain-containing protein [Serinicoccus marinus]
MAQEASSVSTSVWTDGDETLAAEVWSKFTVAARKVFDVMIDNPGKHYGSERLAELAGLETMYMLAGMVSWPKKHCERAGKEPLFRTHSLSTGGSNYWMEETTARVFREARDMA